MFINRKESSLDLMDEYSEQLSELRRFRLMAGEIPERVAFPLFEIGTTVVREEIILRINNYMKAILRKFEYDLKERAKSIS